MKVKYVGPYAAGVTIQAIGLHVDPGETVEVPDELGTLLLEQEDVWAPSRAKASNVEPDDEPVEVAAVPEPDEDEIT